MSSRSTEKTGAPTWRLKRWLWVLILLLVVVGAFRYSVFRITKNFHEVQAGKFYRSAQLTSDEMEEVIKKYGIKTVISLRGAPEHAYWYGPQKEVLEKNGVSFKALWWAAEFFPPRDELIAYLDLLKTAEYPVLVHCRTGADRTGTAAALYSMEYMGETSEQAIQKNLNFSYWHVPAFKPAMTEFVRQYHGDQWARTQYDLCKPEYRPYAENPQCPTP